MGDAWAPTCGQGTSTMHAEPGWKKTAALCLLPASPVAWSRSCRPRRHTRPSWRRWCRASRSCSPCEGKAGGGVRRVIGSAAQVPGSEHRPGEAGPGQPQGPQQLQERLAETERRPPTTPRAPTHPILTRCRYRRGSRSPPRRRRPRGPSRARSARGSCPRWCPQ